MFEWFNSKMPEYLHTAANTLVVDEDYYHSNSGLTVEKILIAKTLTGHRPVRYVIPEECFQSLCLDLKRYDFRVLHEFLSTGSHGKYKLWGDSYEVIQQRIRHPQEDNILYTVGYFENSIVIIECKEW